MNWIKWIGVFLLSVITVVVLLGSGVGIEATSWVLFTVVSVFVLVVVLLVKLGFYTTLDTGNIKYIYRGETLLRIIADVPGKIVRGHKLVRGVAKKSWLQKWFGLYYVGIPGIASVRHFNIKKKKEVEITEGKSPIDWIEDSGSVEVDSLRARFPRPFLLVNVELGDRQTVTLLVVVMLEVVDAYIPVPQLKGDFFGNTASTLRAAIDDILKAIESMDAFIAVTKGEGGVLSPMENSTLANGEIVVSAFNKKLEQQVGLHLVGAAIADWDPSDKAIREAMNKNLSLRGKPKQLLLRRKAMLMELQSLLRQMVGLESVWHELADLRCERHF